jgi:hypothetical protein
MLVVLVGLVDGMASEPDPYLAWSQGRPAESAPLLLERARSLDSWPAWNDAGLAWAEAGERGLAAACLLRAHHLAPGVSEPLRALGLVADGVRPSWSSRLGPFALLGQGWPALGLAAIAGLALGWSACAQSRRGSALAIGLVALGLVAPAAVADMRDRQQDLAVTLRTVDLVNASGAAITSLDPGTIVRIEPGASWNGRLRVVTGQGASGFMGRHHLALAREADSVPSASNTP